MAMNADNLAVVLKDKRELVMAAYVYREGYDPEIEGEAYRLAMAKADAEAIIEHIQTNAQVGSLVVINTSDEVSQGTIT